MNAYFNAAQATLSGEAALGRSLSDSGPMLILSEAGVDFDTPEREHQVLNQDKLLRSGLFMKAKNHILNEIFKTPEESDNQPGQQDEDPIGFDSLVRTVYVPAINSFHNESVLNADAAIAFKNDKAASLERSRELQDEARNTAEEIKLVRERSGMPMYGAFELYEAESTIEEKRKLIADRIKDIHIARGRFDMHNDTAQYVDQILLHIDEPEVRAGLDTLTLQARVASFTEAIPFLKTRIDALKDAEANGNDTGEKIAVFEQRLAVIEAELALYADVQPIVEQVASELEEVVPESASVIVESETKQRKPSLFKLLGARGIGASLRNFMK